MSENRIDDALEHLHVLRFLDAASDEDAVIRGLTELCCDWCLGRTVWLDLAVVQVIPLIREMLLHVRYSCQKLFCGPARRDAGSGVVDAFGIEANE